MKARKGEQTVLEVGWQRRVLGEKTQRLQTSGHILGATDVRCVWGQG